MSIKITDVRALKGDSAFLIDMALGREKASLVFKNAKVVAGEYAVKIFEKPTAKAVMRDLDRKFALKNGVSDYVDLTDNLTVHIALKDNDKIKAGDMEFTALNLTGHTKCSVGYYLESEKLLLSTESLGVYTEDGEVVPSYLVGYQMVIDSIKRVMSLGAERLLIPHYGVIEGDEVKAYLNKALKNATETADEIVKILKSGKSKEDAVNYFVSKFYKGKVKEIYPYDAMMLNTSITVNLIEKELL